MTKRPGWKGTKARASLHWRAWKFGMKCTEGYWFALNSVFAYFMAAEHSTFFVVIALVIMAWELRTVLNRAEVFEQTAIQAVADRLEGKG